MNPAPAAPVPAAAHQLDQRRLDAGGKKTSNILNDGYVSIDSIYLRVRVGWFTRTDVMPLDMALALAGPSHGVYNGPGPFHGTCF